MILVYFESLLSEAHLFDTSQKMIHPMRKPQNLLCLSVSIQLQDDLPAAAVELPRLPRMIPTWMLMFPLPCPLRYRRLSG